MDHAKKMLERDVTLLFVSHSMFAVKALCDRAIYLAQGRLTADGTTEEVTRHYDQDSRLDMAAWAQNMVGSDPSKCPIFIEKVEMLDEAGNERTIFDFGERVRLRLHYNAREPIAEPNFNVCFLRSDDIACCNYNTALANFPTGTVHGPGVIEMLTPPLKLIAELYSMQILVWDPKFSRLYCAQQGKNFHVRHPLLSTEFGIFHEPAEWRWAGQESGARGQESGVRDAAGALISDLKSQIEDLKSQMAELQSSDRGTGIERDSTAGVDDRESDVEPVGAR
jgi:lipopolysaccharide transport system ATP-binding protein